MPIIYNNQSYPLVYEQVVIDKLEEIVNDNICYGLYTGNLDHALERNDNLFNDIIEANSSVFENPPFATLRDGSPIFRITVEAIRYSGNPAYKDGVPTNKKIKFGGNRRASNLRYYMFIILQGNQFVSSALFGVVQNWEDGYLKNTLHATINESYHRRMFIRESADKLLSYYLIHNRKTLDNYLCYNCV